MRQWLTEMRQGLLILASRKFWRAFAHYWSEPEIGRRMDDWTSRFREGTGQEPDWDVERRRAKRR